MIASAQPSVKNFAKGKSENFATAMIEESQYRLPRREQPEPKPKADPATIAYLESLEWRPHGIEW